MVNFLAVAALALAASQSVSAAPAPGCKNPSVRKSWAVLTTAQKQAYIAATKCLMDPKKAPSKTKYAGSRTRWEELQVTHVAQVQFIHGVGAFLPWHRWFMTVHENLLRNECGYRGPLPYWDEQAEQAKVQLVDSGIWSADPLTGFGSAQVDENDCVIDGAFSGLELDLTIQLTRGEPTCLKRTLKQDQFDLVSQKVVDACMTLDTYATFSACLGGTPHTSGHYAVGGTMDDVSLSPADPLFFMHHTNLDRLWWEWQSKNASRLTDMTGRNVAAGGILVANQPAILPVSAFLPYFNDGGDVTTLNHVLWTSGTAENVTIGDVMDINSPTICAAFE
ncbi:hypothetical protein B0T11DRAFT_332315 [Plectosphaerella cucumerina]|uniref:Tyrosinase copper-binding domain-containing protein n=1 Tax=Plectosphaerella cucumerina TaxID=40658 RepID=A0A8K0T9Q5_9PEZI|nr:hypothetical protein B0T11DRAFT_332315 [Plectosphaerella cucumerina]